MTELIDAVAAKVDTHLGGKVRRVASLGDEIAYEVEPADLLGTVVHHPDPG